MNGKNVALTPAAFFVQQLSLMGPLAAPVWIAGLWASSRRPRLAVYRAFPIAYVILFIFFVVTHGKAYYMTPIYPTLFGIGAVAIESRLQSVRWRRAALWARRRWPGVSPESVPGELGLRADPPGCGSPPGDR